jgi:hypothetical protein
MTREIDVPAGHLEDRESKKKPYTHPLLVEIGATMDIVQSYYCGSDSDGYARYYYTRARC